MEERDRLRNPSINFPRSEEEACLALIAQTRRALFGSGDAARAALGKTYTTNAGLGATRSQESAEWLTRQQSVLSAALEDVLDRFEARIIHEVEEART